ncbi:GAF domain-containing protein [Pseudorhodoferax sp.]|uniref:GAF domain-containing protein n=1 Tax=Pseudorhodoferax sp. TaxID=1993553 RepID=UPI002DD69FF9|nr:GAF domain-containing protein [Pseudorhodoferax sp.]
MATPFRPMPSNGAQWRARELQLLGLLVQQLGDTGTPDPLLQTMLRQMDALLELQRGRIVLAVPGDAHARIHLAHGLTEAEIAHGVYAPGEGVTGLVLASGQAMLVPDIDAEPRFLARSVARNDLPEEDQAFLALPIQRETRTIGVLSCHRSRRPGRTLDDDLGLLRVLAALAGQRLRVGTPRPLVRPYLPAHSHSLAELERMLALYGGKQARAANALGLTLRQFGYRLRKARAEAKHDA